MPCISALTGVASVDKLIGIGDPRRDTGVGNEIVLSGTFGIKNGLIEKEWNKYVKHQNINYS